MTKLANSLIRLAKESLATSKVFTETLQEKKKQNCVNTVGRKKPAFGLQSKHMDVCVCVLGER